MFVFILVLELGRLEKAMIFKITNIACIYRDLQVHLLVFSFVGGVRIRDSFICVLSLRSYAYIFIYFSLALWGLLFIILGDARRGSCAWLRACAQARGFCAYLMPQNYILRCLALNLLALGPN